MQSMQVQDKFQSSDVGYFATLFKSALGIFLIYPFFRFLLSSICVAFLRNPGSIIALKKFYISSLIPTLVNSYLNPIIYCWKIRHSTRCHGHTLEHVTARGRNQPSRLIYNQSSNVVHGSLLCD